MYFDNFTNKEKIILYIIPIMIIILYFIYKPKIVNENYNANIYSTNNKSQIEMINYFEEVLKKDKIDLTSIILGNRTINIKINSNINKIVKFINNTYLEYKIISYNIIYNNKKIYLDITYNINKKVNYQKNNISKYKLKNPFIKMKSKNTKLTKAIIGEYVLIDNRWYKKGDNYKNKIITNIYKNEIELKDKNNISILKVFDEK